MTGSEPNDSHSIAAAFDLTGRVAVVTGAASGIGRATAILLGRAGASMVLCDIDGDGAQVTAATIAAESGAPVVAMRTDVTSRADILATVGRATAEYGQLDIMCNIAGVPYRSLVTEVTDADFDRVMAINLKSVLYGCQAALDVMIPRQSGVIVNIASGAVDTPSATLGLYAMSKAAVAMLTKTLAMEVGQYGIRVNAISPGIILSNFSRPHFSVGDGEVDEEKLAAFKTRASGVGVLGRIGAPEDVAWSILYAVSDVASFVTGQIFRPNGGAAMP